MTQPRQIVATVVYGSHAGRLDETFTSFLINPGFELHAFILGERLPERRAAGVEYHLRPFDPDFLHPLRDADFRRWMLFDELGADYALVVDGVDVACLRPIPPIPQLLRGSAVGGCVEHAAARYFENGVYTAHFLNAGVTFWDVRASKAIREEIVGRGRARFRSLIDDQLSLNEVIHCHHIEKLMILPSIYNHRAFLGGRPRRWPIVDNLDGVYIYHNDDCSRLAKNSTHKDRPEIPSLEPDRKRPSPSAQLLRRLRARLDRHIVRVPGRLMY